MAIFARLFSYRVMAVGLGLLAACGKAEKAETEITEPESTVAEAPAEKPEPVIIYDETPPAIPDNVRAPAMLVFSKTAANGFRHEDGIPAGNAYLEKMGRELGYTVYVTENGAVFNEDQLALFELVVFNSATGDMLSHPQEVAFQAWLQAGGGWIGVHGSGDASHDDWGWYANELIGPKFTMHPMQPQFQSARVETLRTDHPVMDGIPQSWEFEEEWYSFDSPASDHGMTVLAGLDESTYDPTLRAYGEETDLRMGPTPQDHPIIWSRCVGEGRSVYSALGHRAVSFDAENHQKLLRNAANWVTGKTDANGDGCQ